MEQHCQITHPVIEVELPKPDGGFQGIAEATLTAKMGREAAESRQLLSTDMFAEPPFGLQPTA